MRVSGLDTAVLALAALLTAALAPVLPDFAWVVALAVGHFFLFCNVVGVRRSLELVWALTLILNALAWRLAGELGGEQLLVSQLPITALVVALELTLRRRAGRKRANTRSG